MNQTLNKLAVLNVSSFRHINTSLTSVEEWVNKHEPMVEFTIGGCQYFISAPEEGRTLHQVYVLDGSILCQGSIFLEHWEYVYLTQGVDAVNQLGMYRSYRVNDVIDQKQFDKWLKHWAEEYEGENDMVAHHHATHTPIKMLANGEWEKGND